MDTKYRDAMSRYNQGINAEGSGTNFLGVVTDAGGIDQILRKIGYVNDAWENVNGQISISYALAGKNAEEVLAMYKELQHVLLSDDSWQSMADSWLGDSSQDVLNNVQRQIEFYQGLVDDYNSAQENFLKNEAVIDLGETLKTTDINTQDAFDGYIQGIKDSTEYSEDPFGACQRYLPGVQRSNATGHKQRWHFCIYRTAGKTDRCYFGVAVFV